MQFLPEYLCEDLYRKCKKGEKHKVDTNGIIIREVIQAIVEDAKKCLNIIKQQLNYGKEFDSRGA
jgi:hypothetical protein